MAGRTTAAFLSSASTVLLLWLPPAFAQAQTSTAGWRTSRGSATGTLGLLPPPTVERGRIATVSGESSTGSYTLPNTNGQVWQEYDISRYTNRHTADAKPEQTIIDWILRETGTEMWFSEPLGLLSADRNTLRVYHTAEIQRIVADVVHRFTRQETDSYAFGVRLCTLSSPNWRTKALPRLKPVSVQTAGVEAWLMSHEDAAIIVTDLRKRTDFREHNSPNLLIRNGDTHSVARQRPVAYMRGIRPFENGLVGNQMEMGRVTEGFNLRLSPLMTTDTNHADAVIKIETNQIERMKPVSVSAPTAQNPRQMVQIQVPQTSSWRLHERFHWPANEVLLISCGVVASPGPDDNKNSLGLPKLVPGPPRSDALLFVDAKGRSADWMTDRQGRANGADGDLNYRGRY